MRSETSTIITNNYPGELITFLSLNLPPAFKGAAGELLLLFLSETACNRLVKKSFFQSSGYFLDVMSSIIVVKFPRLKQP